MHIYVLLSGIHRAGFVFSISNARRRMLGYWPYSPLGVFKSVLRDVECSPRIDHVYKEVENALHVVPILLQATAEMLSTP